MFSSRRGPCGVKLGQERTTQLSPRQGDFNPAVPHLVEPNHLISWGTLCYVCAGMGKNQYCVMRATMWCQNGLKQSHPKIWTLGNLNGDNIIEKHARNQFGGSKNIPVSLSQEVAHTQVTMRPLSLWMPLATSLLVYLGQSGSMMQGFIYASKSGEPKTKS